MASARGGNRCAAAPGAAVRARHAPFRDDPRPGHERDALGGLRELEAGAVALAPSAATPRPEAPRHQRALVRRQRHRHPIARTAAPAAGTSAPRRAGSCPRSTAIGGAPQHARWSRRGRAAGAFRRIRGAGRPGRRHCTRQAQIAAFAPRRAIDAQRACRRPRRRSPSAIHAARSGSRATGGVDQRHRPGSAACRGRSDRRRDRATARRPRMAAEQAMAQRRRDRPRRSALRAEPDPHCLGGNLTTRSIRRRRALHPQRQPGARAAAVGSRAQ